MKTNSISSKLLFALLFSTSGLIAQNNQNSILVSSPKFAQPLIEKWISEYSKVKPEANIKFVQKDTKSSAPQLNLVIASTPYQLSDNNHKFIITGRYALVPVSNSGNPLLAEIGRKGLDKKDLDKLFFESLDEDPEELEDGDKKLSATVYSAENSNRQSATLAKHFGHLSSELKGKKVLGDEIFLLSALKKDPTGISYNNLNYLFDTNSRKIKPEITLIPLELKKDAKPLLSGNIDDALDVLEENQIETIPVGKIGFVYTQQDAGKEITDFLRWVLADGQKYNHDLGFLKLDNQDLLTAQRSIQEEKLLSLK